MNKVSVVVLTYNQENFIKKNLLGIFMQNVNFPIELIICDDNSTDNTSSVIKNMVQNKPDHIELKFTSHQNNLGSTPNFYYALKQCTGTYVAFCEGDDYWTDEKKLQIQYDFLEQNKEYSMCFHQATNVYVDSCLENSLFSKVENRNYTALEIYQHWIVHTATVFMRSEILGSDVVKEMFKNPYLLYFDTVLYMASSLYGKIKGLPLTMSSYLRHEEGLSNGINFRRDLRHNQLDEFIGSIYKGKIQDESDWQIFSRSRIAFNKLLKDGKISLAFQHLKWILKKKKNLKIYLKKKYR